MIYAAGAARPRPETTLMLKTKYQTSKLTDGDYVYSSNHSAANFDVSEVCINGRQPLFCLY
jgi:hypothetical protein